METTLTLEVITPVFMSGANQSVPELRAASFKGALRYWFRAMMGNVTKNIDKLKSVEADIFGSTEKTSNLIIYIADKREDIYRITENNDTEVKDGIAYLGYAFVKWTKGKGFVWKKPYYIPVLGGKGTYFAIKFIFRRFDVWKRYRNAIEASLWLLSHFGGLGARTRRGFGSIRCRDIDSSWLDWSYSCDDQYFRKNLEKIQKEFINLASVSSPSGTDEYPLLRVGEYIHVGKAVTFGLGKYSL